MRLDHFYELRNRKEPSTTSYRANHLMILKMLLVKISITFFLCQCQNNAALARILNRNYHVIKPSIENFQIVIETGQSHCL